MNCMVCDKPMGEFEEQRMTETSKRFQLEYPGEFQPCVLCNPCSMKALQAVRAMVTNDWMTSPGLQAMHLDIVEAIRRSGEEIPCLAEVRARYG